MKKTVIFLLVLSTLLFAQTMKDYKMTSLMNKEVSLYDYTKKKDYTFVSLFSLDCRYCMSAVRDYVKLVPEYQTKNIGFLAFYYEKDPKVVENIITKEKINFPVFLTTKRDFIEDFQIRGVPFTLLVDKNQKILHRIPGYVPYESMVQLLNELILVDKGKEKTK